MTPTQNEIIFMHCLVVWCLDIPRFSFLQAMNDIREIYADNEEMAEGSTGKVVVEVNIAGSHNLIPVINTPSTSIDEENAVLITATTESSVSENVMSIDKTSSGSTGKANVLI